MNYNGSSVSEPEKIAKSLIFFVESIASSNKDNVEECDHFKLRNFISRACLSRARLLKCRHFFFFFFVGPPQMVGHGPRRLETGDKNRDDFRCMQMSLVMSMGFIFGGD